MRSACAPSSPPTSPPSLMSTKPFASLKVVEEESLVTTLVEVRTGHISSMIFALKLLMYLSFFCIYIYFLQALPLLDHACSRRHHIKVPSGHAFVGIIYTTYVFHISSVRHADACVQVWTSG